MRMKRTFDRGYQRFSNWNLFWSKFAYIDVRFRKLAGEEQWYYTDTDLYNAKISLKFDDHSFESEEYELGRRFVFVICYVPRWQVSKFIEVMETRNENLIRMCGNTYSTMLADLNATVWRKE